MASQHLIVSDAGLSEVSVMRWREGKVTESKDSVAEETPIALIYNGISHAVMLATPLDLEDFALGFSLSEGILRHRSELYGVEVVSQENGVELRLDVATEAFVKLKERRRNLTGRTGCGLCGAESLEHALRLPDADVAKMDALQASNHAGSGGPLKIIKAQNIQKSAVELQDKQVLQRVTGATHACAWVDRDGEIRIVREDVGRHNAMDKLIGALAKQPPQDSGFVLTSSRASVEMVQKVALAGYQVLAAISAPTGLAVRVAQAYGVTLVGFLREQQFVIYSHANRIDI